MEMPTPRPGNRRGKLHPRCTPYVFAFYMATIMAFLMCCVVVATQAGFAPGYWTRVLYGYLVAMPVAFCCVIAIRPAVTRLVAATVRSD